MPTWNQTNIMVHMQVYSSDNQNMGHIAAVYEDSFLIHKGIIFSKDRYIPYSAIASIKEDNVQLSIDAAEVNDREWEKRPNYSEHPGDPTQLFYDRGHGVQDPFDPTKPDQAERT
jgi:hypothetical protein